MFQTCLKGFWQRSDSMAGFGFGGGGSDPAMVFRMEMYLFGNIQDLLFLLVSSYPETQGVKLNSPPPIRGAAPKVLDPQDAGGVGQQGPLLSFTPPPFRADVVEVVYSRRTESPCLLALWGPIMEPSAGSRYPSYMLCTAYDNLVLKHHMDFDIRSMSYALGSEPMQFPSAGPSCLVSESLPFQEH